MAKIYLSRKRTVIVNKKRFFTFILICVLSANFVLFGLLKPFGANADEAKPPIEITVKSGDTLWSIADKYADDREIRDLVQKIKNQNNLKNADLKIGQKLLIPVK